MIGPENNNKNKHTHTLMQSYCVPFSFKGSLRLVSVFPLHGRIRQTSAFDIQDFIKM